ncbi:efflux RND transporter periplasmic adaptor subunit [Salipiger sp.]|uniref:efflux RND transporter periplasmic adaptor subunit n=1 Tax=Salipiger sp. TaxID=2078585 RepID=UPI003A980469
MTSISWRALLPVAAICAALSSPGPAVAQGAPGGAAGPTAVGTLTLAQEDVPFTTELPGRATAFEQVDIRPRIEGTIEAILFEPGRRLNVGDPLYRIDSATYMAELDAAKADLARAEAAVAASEATLARYERLEGTGVTTEDVETARVTVLQNRADLSAADAARRQAQLNLDHAEITSPIVGIAAVSHVSVGAVVTANQTDALTTVTRLDPIYVDVEESSRRMAEVRNLIDSGSLTRGTSLKISLELETGETYGGEGTLVSPGNAVSTTTGTAQFRMRFDNPERRILPGQFLRVTITLGTRSAVLVPQRATTRQADGSLTVFVAVDGKAQQRVLTANGSYRNAWIITEGVAAGDTVIVDGLTNLRDGAAVAPVDVVITEDGVVKRADGRDEAFAAPQSGGN